MNQTRKLTLLIGISLLVLMVLSTPQARGEIIVVDDEEGHWADYNNIHDAVNHSSVNDTIRIFEGSYTEYVYIDKTIDIVGNGTEKTIVRGNKSGVFLVGADNVSIRDLSITQTYWNNYTSAGVYIYNNHFLTITNCRFYNNSAYSIFFNHSNNSSILNSIVENNMHGIHLYNSSDSQVLNCTIVKTTFYGLITGKINNRLVVSNSEFSKNDDGIWLAEMTRNATIDKCHIHNNSDTGILISSDSTNFISNSIINSNHRGIYIWSDSNNNIILNCTTNLNTDSGVYFRNSHSNRLINSTSNFNGNYGIEMWDASNTTIRNCTFKNNNENGIYLRDSNDNTIIHSVISNSIDGLYLLSSNSNHIKRCTITLNYEYGIYFHSARTGDDCSSNLIHHNYFFNNGISPQALVESGSNTWDNGTEGNWWSDYNGSDLDGDGIGDSPYVVDGDDRNRDYYPLVYPYPTEEVPDNVTISLSAFPSSPLEDQLVTIVCRITSTSIYRDATFSIFINDELNEQMNLTLLEGDTFWSIEWKATQGTTTIRAVIGRPIDISDEIDIEIIKKSFSDSATSIPNIGYVLLALSTVLLATIPRRSY